MVTVTDLKHKYSPTEEVLLKILPTTPKRITISELTARYYVRIKKEVPFHGRIYINSSMLTLMKKAKANKDVKIMRSNVRPFEYWIVGK